MAADFGIYFREADFPSFDEWQAACQNRSPRIRLYPVDLRTHSGTLPAVSEGTEFNFQFEFQISHHWRGLDTIFDGESALFAHFRCFAAEWEATAHAALAFMSISDGVFSDPFGAEYHTFDYALRYVQDSLKTKWQRLASDPSQKLAAIKAYQSENNTGIADAKAVIEAYLRNSQGT